MAKAKLNDEVKTFIVHALACFDSPSTVSAAVKKEFGVDASRQLVESYDPNKRAAVKLAPKWKALFEASRKAFIDDQSGIGITHRSVRLRKLAQQVELNESRGNSAMVAQLLKQAAEEVGNAYTNKREFSGPGGGPIKTEARTWREVLREEGKE